MPKINSYVTVSEPKLSDKLIGTSVGGTPDNETYNFTLQQLKDLFDGTPIPSNLQQVLDAGNSATEDIFLTGKIHTTDLEVFNEAQLSTVFISGLLYDGTNSFGTAGQFLSSTGAGVEWITVSTDIPTLQQVLNSGNIATQSITLTGAFESTSVQATTITASSDLNVSGTLTDGIASDGTSGQVLSSTGSSVRWIDLPLFSAVSPLIYNNPLKQFSIQVANGTQNGYLSSTDWINFDGKQIAGNYITSLTGEATASGPGASAITLGTSAVTGKILTGLNITGGSVASTDSILTAFGKVQNQLNGLVGGVVYQGTWDASSNTPTLVSGVGTQGHYYIVNVPGGTNLDGITDWALGDWVIFDGTAWQQVDNTDAVVSVNGFTGAVSLTTSNIPEATNLYYLDSRARAAISLTTLGTGGAATYDNISGVLNIPNYTTDLSGYVPYTGATADVDLGVNAIIADHLSLSTTSIAPVNVGDIVWNADDGTFDMGLLNGVTLQAGQEANFYGKAVGAIGNGKAVMFAGVQGDHLLMSEAVPATINANPQYFIGVATQDFINNQFGYVTVLGKVRELDTLGYTLGSILYFDSASVSNGLLTETLPTAPNAKIEVAAVVRVHGTQGILMVRPHVMPKLAGLQDVYAPSVSNKQGLFWNSTTLRYESNTVQGVLGYTPADDSKVVHKALAETITGVKTFNAATINEIASSYKKTTPTVPAIGYTNIAAGNAPGYTILSTTDGDTTAARDLYFPTAGGGTISYEFQNTPGTIAFLSDIPSVSPSVMNAGSGTCSIVGSGSGNSANGNYSFAGGGLNNISSGEGSFVGGGGGNSGLNNTASGCFSLVGGGRNNSATAFNSVVVGGGFSTTPFSLGNTACGISSFVGGGSNNIAGGCFSFIGGGLCNSASGYYSFIGGGASNIASGIFNSSVLVGQGNSAAGNYATVVSGISNSAAGNSATVLGGQGNIVCNTTNYGLALGGANNIVSADYAGVFGCGLTNSQACTFMANNFVIGDFANPSFDGCSLSLINGKICIGSGGGGASVMNAGTGFCSIVGSGSGNVASALYSTASGGYANVACGNYSNIAGGRLNTACNINSFIGGGLNNCSYGISSTLSGGYNNKATGNTSTISGGYSNTASGDISFIGGGKNNVASALYSSVSGGCGNTASSYYSTVSGGYMNSAIGNQSYVGAGSTNTASGNGSVVVGGAANNSCTTYSTIVGGFLNTSNGSASVIVGGVANANISDCSFIGGGSSNNINSGGPNNVNQVIVGGKTNTISTYCGFNIIGGGQSNTIGDNPNVTCAFIGGGRSNVICGGRASAIAGGSNHIIANNISFIGAGTSNNIQSSASGILGGCANTISAYHLKSFIVGSNLTSGAACTTYTNALSKASGTFRISHPDPSKTATKYLQHSFVESPTRGDNIYRFSICTTNCAASIVLPDYYKFLNEDDQVWISPKNHFGNAYGVIDSTQSTVGITANADGEYNVLVIGTRKDIDAKNGFLGVEVWK